MPFREPSCWPVTYLDSDCLAVEERPMPIKSEFIALDEFMLDVKPQCLAKSHILPEPMAVTTCCSATPQEMAYDHIQQSYCPKMVSGIFNVGSPADSGCETPVYHSPPPQLGLSPTVGSPSRMSSIDQSAFSSIDAYSDVSIHPSTSTSKIDNLSYSAKEDNRFSFDGFYCFAPIPELPSRKQPIVERLQSAITSYDGTPGSCKGDSKPRSNSFPTDLYSPRKSSRQTVRRKSTPVERVGKRQKKKIYSIGQRLNVVHETKSTCSFARDACTEQPRFSCIFARYGCDRQFKCKNEWKRHINTQHLELEEYLCDLGQCKENAERARSQGGFGSCSKDIHFFNRKDLFISHLRRHHDPGKPDNYSGPITFDKTSQASIKEAHVTFESQISEICRRCFVHVRHPPALSGCTYCGMTFDTWSKRLEHVGCHFEKGDTELQEEDVDLRDWAIQEGILTRSPQGFPFEWIVAKRPR
ncbi:hypothetical protein KEM54_001507 [Ascosphaera aggregata]|nr:hypothetical protein KEM54_001507 [Ascosphaera aggregata]